MFLSFPEVQPASEGSSSDESFEEKENEQRTPKKEWIQRTKKQNQMLVFCNTKRDADSVDNYLMRQGFASVSVHGDRNQIQRTQAIRSFREGYAQVLVATSVSLATSTNN